jgi:hypothetical protein
MLSFAAECQDYRMKFPFPPIMVLLLGPDYGAFPLWDRSPHGFWGGIAEGQLPISAGLVARLQAWNDDWEGVNEPVSANLAQWGKEWNNTGGELLLELRRELEPNVEVSYFAPDDLPPWARN